MAVNRSPGSEEVTLASQQTRELSVRMPQECQRPLLMAENRSPSGGDGVRCARYCSTAPKATPQQAAVPSARSAHE